MKKPRIIHYGFVKNGKKNYYQTELYAKQLAELEGKEFEEEIREKVKKTSRATTGYYRAGVLRTALQCEVFIGWSEEELHQYFTSRHLSTVIEKFVNGERVEIPTIISTSELNQSEMNDYIQKVTVELAEMGIEVLPPENYTTTKYRPI